MQAEQLTHTLRCDWEPCAKKLLDFCYVCAETGKYFCDEICRDRDFQDTRAAQMKRWH